MAGMRALLVACALLAVGCGGDDDGDGSTPDAPPGPDVAVGADAGPDAATLSGDEYRDPADFPRVPCAPGSLAGLDPYAVWSADVEYDFGGGFTQQSPTVFKIVEGLSGLQAYIGSGGVTAEVTLTADDLLARRVTTDGFGYLQITALDACALDQDGALRGTIVSCRNSNVVFGDPLCASGAFRAVRLERLAGEADAQGLSLVGEFRGASSNPWGAGQSVNVRVVDGVAYVVRLGDGLRIVDVSDPANMKDLARFARPGGYNDVKVFDAGGKRYAAVTRECRGIDVLDVTDPAAPTKVSNFPNLGVDGEGCIHTLFIEPYMGQIRAYFTAGATGGLSVWDLGDPAAPAPLGDFVHPDVATVGGFIHDLSIQDGIAYLNYWNLGFVVVDATDPANMVLVGQYDGYERRTSHSNWTTVVNGCRVAVHGDEDYTAHLRVIGVDPACPATFMQQIGELSLRPEVSIHNIMAFGDKAYVAWYQDGVRIVNLANPAQPTVERWFNTWSEDQGTQGFYEGAVGIDVDLVGGIIYVADLNRGLLVLHID
jgi:hypothetical protein